MNGVRRVVTHIYSLFSCFSWIVDFGECGLLILLSLSEVPARLVVAVSFRRHRQELVHLEQRLSTVLLGQTTSSAEVFDE
jgi:hypothetical protein